MTLRNQSVCIAVISVKRVDGEKRIKKRKYGVHMENPNAAVADMAVKAREAGMTYGQYVAKMGGTDHAEKHKKI